MAQLPPFLQPLSSDSEEPFIHSVFQHSKDLGSTKTLWWPSSDADPNTVVLFIPGNPGLVEFYIPYLSALYEDSDQSLAILAQSHLAHTPEVPAVEFGLAAQVAVAIAALDAIQKTYRDAKVVLIGHSVGTWIGLQVLKARPDAIYSLLLLFPTIANIQNTPNGRSLSWAFGSPLPYIISRLSILLRFLPSSVLSKVFHDWPEPQINVIRRLLHSPSAIYACLSMAHDEMKTIRELDIDLLDKHKHRIHMYFAEKDGWVGKNKDVILRSFDPDRDTVKVVHGQNGIPHAFCINHSKELAAQCTQWISQH